jgi:hypothetical protein
VVKRKSQKCAAISVSDPKRTPAADPLEVDRALALQAIEEKRKINMAGY